MTAFRLRCAIGSIVTHQRSIHAPGVCAFACVLALLLSPSIAAAAEAGRIYESHRGFRIMVPEGWTTLDSQTPYPRFEQLARRFSGFEEIGEAIRRQEIELYMIDAASSPPPPTINVIVRPGTIPINDRTRRAFEAELAKQAQAVEGTIRQIDDIHFIEVRGRQRGLGGMVRQWQYVTSGRHYTYIITFTAPAHGVSRYEPVFESVIAGFQAPDVVAGLHRGGGWFDHPATLGAAIGGAIGIAVAAFLFDRKRRRRASAQ